MISLYISQFLTVALVHLLAVASPGPDFAIVVRQSITYGRKTALYTSFGVGMGIMIHVFYSLLGIGLIVSQSIMLFTIMKMAGAGYLMFIGFKAMRTKKVSLTFTERVNDQLPTPMKAIWTGFLTNGLNPKATLFFLSLFTVVISPETPIFIQFLYGIYMAMATALWFSMVSMLFGQERVRHLFGRVGHWFERLMGLSLCLLGLRLLFVAKK
ncbi:LysE family translocator [Desulfopila aestuarii]|uniref:Resistance to homoserine/threonine (RhtB) family protein n=1 Tax=Desulfopila aestuarii DSM 18488 TaxID=1121416 RepID=A0A1M7Y1H2_9BACT|nr:LysE family transporter [Desulfopila aestuarii]SHO45590.1 resistance to homoserine/threonine (RhtB) family protein [Desulfopila aestuarii DSM 18488]